MQGQARWWIVQTSYMQNISWKLSIYTRDTRGEAFRPRDGAGERWKYAGQGGVGRGKGKIHGAGRVVVRFPNLYFVQLGNLTRRVGAKKSVNQQVRQIFIGHNWTLPCNCLPNFNGLKSTLPRSAPRRFWHYGRIPWKGFWNPSLLEDIIKILWRNMIFISGVSIKRPQVLAYFLYLLIELRGRT